MAIHATEYHEKMARIALNAIGHIEDNIGHIVADLADLKTALENIAEEEGTATVSIGIDKKE